MPFSHVARTPARIRWRVDSCQDYIYASESEVLGVFFFSNINRSYAPYKKSAGIFFNPVDED